MRIVLIGVSHWHTPFYLDPLLSLPDTGVIGVSDPDLSRAGEIDIKPGLLGALGSMESMVTGFVEAIVTTIIPRNLRAVVEAAAAFELPQDTS